MFVRRPLLANKKRVISELSEMSNFLLVCSGFFKGFLSVPCRLCQMHSRVCGFFGDILSEKALIFVMCCRERENQEAPDKALQRHNKFSYNL